jgi:Skp family chaperone for outer membrane proteins
MSASRPASGTEDPFAKMRKDLEELKKKFDEVIKKIESDVEELKKSMKK